MLENALLTGSAAAGTATVVVSKCRTCRRSAAWTPGWGRALAIGNGCVEGCSVMAGDGAGSEPVHGTVEMVGPEMNQGVPANSQDPKGDGAGAASGMVLAATTLVTVASVKSASMPVSDHVTKWIVPSLAAAS